MPGSQDLPSCRKADPVWGSCLKTAWMFIVFSSDLFEFECFESYVLSLGLSEENLKNEVLESCGVR